MPPFDVRVRLGNRSGAVIDADEAEIWSARSKLTRNFSRAASDVENEASLGQRRLDNVGKPTDGCVARIRP